MSEFFTACKESRQLYSAFFVFSLSEQLDLRGIFD